MPHSIVAGVTTSGKTSLAQAIAAARVRAGGGVLVLHRPAERWPLPAGAGPAWQTADPDAFLAMALRSRGCFAFVEMTDARMHGDPYGERIDKSDRRFHALATEGRHLGHWVFFLCQRPVALHPDIRENVESLFLFSIGAESASRLAEEFADSSLLEAATLPRFHYISKANRFTPAVKCQPIRLSRA